MYLINNLALGGIMRKDRIVLFAISILLTSFLIAAPPAPTAAMKNPTPSGWGGCDFQAVRISIADAEGIDETTISLQVDGTVYNWPDAHLAWDGDSILTYTPTSPYPNNYLVTVNLLYVEDTGGTPIAGPASWNYRTDLDEPYFYPSSRTPAPDTTIAEDQPTISIDVADITSGIPIGGLCMCIESIDYNCPADRLSGYCWETSPHITYIDSTFYLITSGLGISFQSEDSVTVCLRKAVDNVPQSSFLCGPNWIDTLDAELCWDFLVDSKGPRATLIYPNVGDTIACDTLVVEFTDFSAILMNTCQLKLDASLAWEGTSPYVNAIGNTVYYTGTGTAEYYSEGAIACRVNRINDINGNQSTFFGGDFVEWNFTVDKSPPAAASPLPVDGGVSSVTSPTVSVQITDAISGVFSDSIIFTVDGLNYPLTTTPGMGWDGTRASFATGAAGLSWSDGDSVEVCVTAIDLVRPDRCGPNRMNPPFCWNFIVDISGPNAGIIDPPDASWTGCEYQEITFWISDVSGIQTSTIEVTIDGFTYFFPDHMAYSSDTLIFTPTIPFTDGSTANVSLNHAEDGFGHDLAAPITSIFYIDLLPPSVTSLLPLLGDPIGPTDNIVVGLNDFGIGIDGASFVMTVRGTPYSWPTYLSWDGSNLTFDLPATGESFTDGDSVQFCVHAEDLIGIDHCGPNELDSCWSLVYDQGGPVANMVYPPDSAVTACASGEIRIHIQDASGLNQSTIGLNINGTPYSWPSPRLSFDGDTLVFTPSSAFTHGDTVDVILTTVEDIVGNPLENAPRSWFFVIDIEPPVMTGYIPNAGDAVSDPTPTVLIGIQDVPAGVDPTLFSLSIEGMSFSWPHAAMGWDGSQLAFDCGLAGFTFIDGDSVHVCMRNAGDAVSAALCGPNVVDFDSCWTFAINLSGPVADLLHPLDHSYSACPLQTVIFSITDDQGVLPESCTVEIEGTPFDYPDHLLWANDSLTFIPTSAFANGETINVAVLDASDSLGNALSGSFTWWFVSDQAPPVLLDIDPPPGSIIADATPVIDIITYDSLSGEDPTSFSIRLDGIDYHGMHPWIGWLDPGFSLQTATGGFSWGDGDTIDVCLDSIADIVAAVYCGPNIARPDTCWQYYVDLSAPFVALIYPDSGIITACLDSGITVYLSDNLGINTDSIRFWINGSNFDLTSPRLSYVNDTLRYDPPTPWVHGDTVEFRVSRAVDFAGNALSGAPTWQFIVDIQPPQIISIDPTPGTILANPAPTLVFGFEDIPAGVDSSSIILNLDGSIYRLTDSGVSWNSGSQELTFDGVAAGASFGPEPLDVCISSTDKVLSIWCGPNSSTDSCFIYPYDLVGPTATPIDPTDGEITACDMVEIRIHLSDDRGVNEDSISLSVDGVVFTTGDAELSYIGDSLLIFVPSASYPEGSIVVILNAVDISVNALSGGPLTYTFFVDTSPPVLSGESPAPGAVIATTTPTIGFDITDTPAGVDESSILFEVAGELAHTTDAGVTWDGTRFSLNPTVFGLTLNDGDSITCCVSAADAPDTCGPNEMGPECWTFYINLAGPSAGIIRPLDGRITACDDQDIALWITDGNGVDEATIVLNVNGSPYVTTGAELSYDGDSVLTFTPSSAWSHGDTVDIQLTDADDIYGSSLGTPLMWNFIVDLEPPIVESINPPTGSDFNVDDTLIEIIITDDPAGVNMSSLSLRVGGVVYSWPHAGLTWVGDTLSFLLSDLGYMPFDGETLDVCVEMVADAPDICEANELEIPVCAVYTFDFRGPYAALLAPPESSWVSCDEQPIEIYLSDANGVDVNTIELVIDGLTYSWPDPLLSYVSPTLTFTPTSPWPEGSWLLVSLTQADDMTGNPLSDAPFEFVFGIDTTAPQVVAVDPPDGGVVDPSYPTISVDLLDNASGIYTASMTITVDGVGFGMGSGATSWDGTTFELDVAVAGLTFEEGDPIEVCIDSVSDLAILCGPNLMPPYCWEFYVDGGPPTAEMLWPPEGAIVSCPSESIIVVFHDPGGINFDSLELSVDGVTYTEPDGEITVLDDSTIKFTPPIPFTHATSIIVQVLKISDNYGRTAGAGPTWSFEMDLQAPVADLFYPTPMVIASSDSISLRIIDLPAGVDPASIILTVTGHGSFDLGFPALYFDDPILAFDADLAGIVFADGDTANICVTAADAPDICAANVMPDTCWSFIVDGGGPLVELILPSPGTITSCAEHSAIFSLTDPSGILESSLRVRVNMAILDVTEPSLSWADPELIYQPLTPWGHGDTVRVAVIGAEDASGNPMLSTDTVGTYYIVDTEPPAISDPFPTDGSIVADPAQPIWVAVTDFPAGIDTSSVRLSVEGIAYAIAHPALYWDGDELHFDPTAAGVTFADGDTVEVCVLDIADEPDTCAPNELITPWCWEFYVNLAGPVARIGQPRSNRWVACAAGEQQLTAIITDPDGIVADSIRLNVEGVVYDVGDIELSYADTVLTFTPSTPWVNGDTINVTLLYVEDSLGNGLGAPLEWSFYIDLEPPYAGTPIPPDGATIGALSSVSIPIYDDGSGVNPTSIVLTIDGDSYSLGSGMTWFGDIASVISDSMLTAPSGSVTVCLDSAADSPDYCGPNVLAPAVCWDFVVDVSNPEAHTIMPGDGDWVACDSAEQRIELYIHDNNGILADSITLRVDGVTYSYVTGPMAYADTILTYVPTSPWIDGETIVVQLLRAPDSLGNPVSPLVFEFNVDLNGPQIDNFLPPDGGSTSSLTPIISARLFDMGCGLDTTSIIATINSIDYPIDITPGLTWNEADSTATLDCAVAGITLVRGDTVDVCFSGADSPDWCPANENSECWSFIADEGGPLVALISPDSNACSACSLQGFSVRITDVTGVDVSTIYFRVNEVPYTIDSAGVVYDAMFGRLDFAPSVPWEDGDIIHVDSLRVQDYDGNWNDHYLEFYIYIDLTPPIVFGFDPPIGGYSSEESPDIYFVLTDSGCGVDVSTVRFSVGGNLYTLDSTGVDYSGDTVTFHCDVHSMTFADGDTVNICVIDAADMATYCSPNVIPDTICWWFIVSTSGPVVSAISPLPGQWVSCDSIEQEIILTIDDPDGIDESTIELIVESVSYDIDSTGLEFEPSTSELHFTPSEFWTDGDTIEVILYSAEDSMGHDLAMPYSFSFYVDTLPPDTAFAEPEVGIAIHPGPIWVMAGIVDVGAGVVDSTIGISINGVWHDVGDLGVSWVDDTLIYNGFITGDTLFAAETLEVCVRGADDIDVCDPNWMNRCWEYIATSNGPVATPVFPSSGTVISCMDSLVVFEVFDTDGDQLDYTSFVVVVNDDTSSGWPTIHHYDDSDSLLYINPGTAPPAPPGTRDHGDTLIVTLIECNDVYRSPLAAPLTIWFVLDSTGPVIISGVPSLGGSVPPGTPDMGFSCADTFAGIDHGIGEIAIGPYVYEIGTDIFFIDDSLEFPTSAYSADTSFFDGDTIHIIITLYDSAQYCGPNVTIIDWWFIVGVSPPVLTNLSPPDGAISSCPFGNIIIYTDDVDGFDYDHTGINVNGIDYDATLSPEINVHGDTLLFNADTAFTHGSVVTYYPFGEDIHGTPAEFADTFSFTIDTEPPVATGYLPIPNDSITDWEASIHIELADDLAGLADSAALSIITPRWTRVFAAGSTEVSWIDGVFDLDVPAYNGGTPWSPALDDELIYWHERDTINLGFFALDKACCCDPNDSIYAWNFTILDDDSIGPDFADIEPTEVYSGFAADVSATVTDISGVFDDMTAGQGMFVLWDSDGDLSDGGETITQMSVDIGDSYQSDTPIGPFAIGETPVFCIIAWDDDFDFLDTLDRAMAISDTIYPTLIEGQGPCAEFLYPADSIWSSCDSGAVIIGLIDADGIDAATIVAIVNGNTVTVGTGLEFSNDSLFWWPDSPLPNGTVVEFELIAVDDLLGYSLDSTYSWSFRIDTEPPIIVLQNAGEISCLNDPEVSWQIADGGSGVDSLSIVIYVDGSPLYPGDPGVVWDGDVLSFDADLAGYDLQTQNLLVCVEVCDLALLCGANCADTTCAVMILQKDTPCDIWPIPFTPNADYANDVVWFEYPNMQYEGARVELYDIEGRRIFDADFPPTAPERDAFWDGIRNGDKKAIPGTYIYIVSRDGEILCKGTLVLVR